MILGNIYRREGSVCLQTQGNVGANFKYEMIPQNNARMGRRRLLGACCVSPYASASLSKLDVINIDSFE